MGMLLDARLCVIITTDRHIHTSCHPPLYHWPTVKKFTFLALAAIAFSPAPASAFIGELLQGVGGPSYRNDPIYNEQRAVQRNYLVQATTELDECLAIFDPLHQNVLNAKTEDEFLDAYQEVSNSFSDFEVRHTCKDEKLIRLATHQYDDYLRLGVDEATKKNATDFKQILADFKEWGRKANGIWKERDAVAQAEREAERQRVIAERKAQWEAERPAREAEERRQLAEFWNQNVITVYDGGNPFCAGMYNKKGVNLKAALNRGFRIVATSFDTLPNLLGGSCVVGKYTLQR